MMTTPDRDEVAAAPSTLIVTGADSNHFANLRVLVGSWMANMEFVSLVVCDFGMTQEQLEELSGITGLFVLPRLPQVTHPWQGKSLVGRYLQSVSEPWGILMWIDADALFNHPLPDLAHLIEGYDVLIDAHRQSVGEIVEACNLDRLPLRVDDAYFSSGWWVVRRGCLVDSYEHFTATLHGNRNLWENDAFVAAIYDGRLRVRTLCGSVWHARGKTSLHSCEVINGKAYHAGQPIYVLHANDGYHLRSDARRILNRPELAGIQRHYETVYQARTGSGKPSAQSRSVVRFGRPIRHRLLSWLHRVRAGSKKLRWPRH